MDQNGELLCEIARSARMGREAAEMLLDKVRAEPMRKEIAQRKAEYGDLEQQADDMLADSGTKPPVVGMGSKAGLWMGLTMNTISDKSDAHIAEMMIQGSGMGVMEMVRAGKRFPQATGPAKALAQRFVEMEEGGIQRMKEFL